jgi:hypothetical protein
VHEIPAPYELKNAATGYGLQLFFVISTKGRNPAAYYYW